MTMKSSIEFKFGVMSNAPIKREILTVAVCFILSIAGLAEAQQKDEQASNSVRQAPTLLTPGEHGIGRYLSNFEVRDVRGTTSELHRNAKSGLTVIAMTSTTCPISKKYLPTLVELHHEFTSKDVRFILVNCIASDKIDEMVEITKKFDTDVEYVFDKDAHIATQLEATSTTDVFLLDASNTVLYHGAIDDQYGFGYSLDSPRSNYLRDAINTALDGHSIMIPATAAPGCALDLQSVAVKNTDVTYHQHIARLMQRHCIECHREGGVGPFKLDTLEDTVAHAAMFLAFLPHMHLRGKAARFELISEDHSEVLLDIPRYDFNWQLLYRYAEPLYVRAGSTVQFTAWYDNSRNNPANPDPTKEVRWGQQTYDEMHLGYVEYIVPSSKLGDPNPLNPRNRIRGAIRDALIGGATNRPNVGNALFLQIDANGDGIVTRDEVQAKYPNNPAASTTIFDRLDKDKNDTLSKVEFSKLAEALGR